MVLLGCHRGVKLLSINEKQLFISLSIVNPYFAQIHITSVALKAQAVLLGSQ